MTNLSIYLPDPEEEWVSRNVDNLSRYVQLHIRNDMRRKEFVEKRESLNQKLVMVQLLSFLFLGVTLLASAVLSIQGNDSVVIPVMIALSGMFAMVYALLSFKINGGLKNGTDTTYALS
ncbi:unnamed protein product [marine sediment metagenome]|uniref:Uncharacterized protein n=1 Tax=marine sediment metagenome TaxID=412755 RepID=X0W2S9_9ZZZZ